MHRCFDRISPVGADVSSFGRKRSAVHILHGGYVHRLADSVSENPFFHKYKTVVYRDCRRIWLDDDSDYDSGAALSLLYPFSIAETANCEAGAENFAPVVLCFRGYTP